MDLVLDVADYGDAPEIYVSGCCRVSRASNGMVRVALFAEREIAEGQVERRIMAQLLCPLEGMREATAVFAAAIHTIETAQPLNGRQQSVTAMAH